MKLRICALTVLVALVASPVSGAPPVLSGAGGAFALTGTDEQLSIALERDFSGTYGAATWVRPDATLVLYFDCVAVAPGTSPGLGEITASGVVTAGWPLPVLRGITVRIVVASGGASLGVADGVRGTGSSCGKGLVPMRPALAARVVFAEA